MSEMKKYQNVCHILLKKGNINVDVTSPIFIHFVDQYINLDDWMINVFLLKIQSIKLYYSPLLHINNDNYAKCSQRPSSYWRKVVIWRRHVWTPKACSVNYKRAPHCHALPWRSTRRTLTLSSELNILWGNCQLSLEMYTVSSKNIRVICASLSMYLKRSCT
jgi:hypothetical protein